MMTTMLNFVDHLECPTVNGIIFPDDKIQLFDIKVNWDPVTRYDITIATKTSVSILKKQRNLHWNYCGILVELIDNRHSIKVIAGGGNYGSDGFIAVLDLKTENLIWCAFSMDSNPFDKIEIEGDEINIQSTLNCTWKFNLVNPINFSVKCPS